MRPKAGGAHLESTTISGLAVRRNVGLGSPTNSQPGRLRYVAQASGLRVLAASSRQFWWYLQDAPARAADPQVAVDLAFVAQIDESGSMLWLR